MSTGIRIFGDDDPTDSMEALAFQYQRQYIDIYSCSWGPADTGWTMEGPEQLARDQLEIGTQIVSLLKMKYLSAAACVAPVKK